MSNDSIPLYVGIPLALLCLAVVALIAVFIIAAWKDTR